MKIILKINLLIPQYVQIYIYLLYKYVEIYKQEITLTNIYQIPLKLLNAYARQGMHL